jgi:predicted RNase H-like HicB family nuclease
MKHYLVVLLPRSEGGWRAYFPDFPGCRAEGASVESAVAASSVAASEKARWLQAQDVSLPRPQTFEEVRDYGNGWASKRGIDWPKALISVVPLNVQDDRPELIA